MDGTASVAAARASPRRRQLPPRPPSCVLVEAATAGEDDERDLGTGAGPRHVSAQGDKDGKLHSASRRRLATNVMLFERLTS